jgi:hypothetical protein
MEAALASPASQLAPLCHDCFVEASDAQTNPTGKSVQKSVQPFMQKYFA